MALDQEAFNQKSKEIKYASHLVDLIAVLPGHTIAEKTGFTGVHLKSLEQSYEEAVRLCEEWCAMLSPQMEWLPPRKHKWAIQ